MHSENQNYEHRSEVYLQMEGGGREAQGKLGLEPLIQKKKDFILNYITVRIKKKKL